MGSRRSFFWWEEQLGPLTNKRYFIEVRGSTSSARSSAPRRMLSQGRRNVDEVKPERTVEGFGLVSDYADMCIDILWNGILLPTSIGRPFSSISDR
jgi:hypothetical protein